MFFRKLVASRGICWLYATRAWIQSEPDESTVMPRSSRNFSRFGEKHESLLLFS